MSEIEIFLEKEIGPDLGSRREIEKLFDNLSSDYSKVIMNFRNIEFMGRSFAQEYLNQKNNASFEIVEREVPNDIQELFDIILKLNNKI